jgi:hypothetical protein
MKLHPSQQPGIAMWVIQIHQTSSVEFQYTPTEIFRRMPTGAATKLEKISTNSLLFPSVGVGALCLGWGSQLFSSNLSLINDLGKTLLTENYTTSKQESAARYRFIMKVTRERGLNVYHG